MCFEKILVLKGISNGWACHLGGKVERNKVGGKGERLLQARAWTRLLCHHVGTGLALTWTPFHDVPSTSAGKGPLNWPDFFLGSANGDVGNQSGHRFIYLPITNGH